MEIEQFGRKYNSFYVHKNIKKLLHTKKLPQCELFKNVEGKLITDSRLNLYYGKIT